MDLVIKTQIPISHKLCAMTKSEPDQEPEHQS